MYAIGWLFWNALSALFPFGIGTLLAYLLMPLVNRLNKDMPRWAAILIVYLGSLLILISLGAYIIPLLVIQVNEFLQSIPSISVQDIEKQVQELLGAYERNVPLQVREPVQEGITSAYETLKQNLTSYVQGLGAFLFNSVMQIVNTLMFLFGFLVVPFWVFYVMNDYRAGYRFVNQMIHPRARADVWTVVKIVDRILSGYIRGQILLGIAVGGAAGAGLFVLRLAGFKIEYILLLAVIAGVTELIPVIGPVIGAVPAIILGLFQSPGTVVAVAILYIGIQMLENNFLVPRIIGESVGIHPAFLIVLMVVMSQVFGFVGIILAAPLSAVVRDIFLYVYGRLQDVPAPAGVLPGDVPDDGSAPPPPAGAS